MALSVSSFPEAPPELVHHSKWQERPSPPKGKRGFFDTLFSKDSVPFLKRIRLFTKENLKGRAIHHPARVPRPRPFRYQHPSSVSTSSIRDSGLVVDLIAIPHNDECFTLPKSDDVDASFPDPNWEPSPPPPATPTALPFPSTTEHVSTTPTSDHAEDPCSPHPPRDCARIPDKNIQQPAKGYDEIAPIVDDSELHDTPSNPPSLKPLAETYGRCQAMTPPTSTEPPSSQTAIFPTSDLLVPPCTEGRLRSHSALTNADQAATKMIPPPRPRYQSETSVGQRGITATSPNSHDASQGKRRGRRRSSPPPPLPDGTRSSAIPKYQHQHQHQHQPERETRPMRPLSHSSSKSVGSSSTKPSELPLSTAHMLCMRSGSRPLPTHLISSRSPVRPSHGAAPQTHSPRTATTTTTAATPTPTPTLARQPPPPEQAAADRLCASKSQRPKTSDGVAAPSRLRTTSASQVVCSSSSDHNHHNHQQQLPPPTPPTSTAAAALLDPGWRSRLPVPSAKVASRAAPDSDSAAR